jgi:hypothetical protein
VLSRILRNPRLDEGLSLFDIAGREPVFLAAYDAGASALIMLAGDRDFVRSRPFIKGIIAIEPFPGPTVLPKPGYPLLVVASDRILGDSPGRQYDAIRLCLQTAGQPAVLAALDGAGPLDYSDFPLKYPLISAFFPGRRREAFKAREAAGGTASIIARFAFRVLEAEVPALRGLYAPPELPAGVRIESRNTLNLF